jgi:hypothetical protein
VRILKLSCQGGDVLVFSDVIDCVDADILSISVIVAPARTRSWIRRKMSEYEDNEKSSAFNLTTGSLLSSS